ncbi:ABC transporter ATP-binding protein [Marinigracilibium pacificum]|uniref:ATP-binding cassette domain-containing protein n=1 Tax=Marinigracilibium pacificum TaxID=2729599 RepID=A0A848J367_9BACT|nr:ATP-binding cassette domain-containing protein [Marinigracilibium pacificum]NMM50171.1 ATP-binding cassette domain-containing protein [Marinigracilibium pacificum]
MIEIKDIRKSFKGTEVIKGISGQFQEGQVNMIIGASGTGKSVLLKCIVGLITPNEGNIFYKGRDFFNSDKEIQRQIRQEIGMLFQGGALFDSMTVEQNVMFPLNILTNMSHSEKLDRVNFCLERVGLENVNKKMPSEISGGMKKRVGIARAIVNNSKFLFCDEPNSGLDPQTSILIDELIKEITFEYNITTVVVTHDMNSVIEIGDYIMFIYQGQKLWDGTKDNILYNDVPELQEFIFANHILRRLKEQS